MRGAHQIGFRAGRVRFIGSRWQGLRFPSPFLVFLPAPPLPPQPPPTLPQRRRRSARAGPRRACLNVPRPWAAQGSVCPRLPGAPHRLFRRLLAGGRWATDCCPAHAASACSEGLGALALPNPAPPPPGTVRRTLLNPSSAGRAVQPAVLYPWVVSADGLVCFLRRCSAGRRPETPQSWFRRAYVIRGGGRSSVQEPLGRRRRRRRGCLRRRRIGGTFCTGRAAGTTAAAGATRSCRPPPRRPAGGTRPTTRRRRRPCGTTRGPRRAGRRSRAPQVGPPPSNPQI